MRPRRRPALVWAPASALAVVILLTLTLWPQDPPVETYAISEWTSPTASLLEPPGGDLLSGVPELGVTDEEDLRCVGCF